MERKLGIDWEHSQNSSITFKSLQTNQLVDGAAEAENSEFSLDESEHLHKKSIITAVFESGPSSRNISIDDAKKRVSAVVNMNVNDF